MGAKEEDLLAALQAVQQGIADTFDDQREIIVQSKVIRQREEEGKARGKIRVISLLMGLAAGIFLAGCLSIALLGLADDASAGSTICIMFLIGCLFFLYGPYSFLKNGYLKIPENKIVQMILFLTVVFLFIPLLILAVFVLINGVYNREVLVYILLAVGPGGGLAIGYFGYAGWKKQLTSDIEACQKESAEAAARIHQKYQELQEKYGKWYPAGSYSWNEAECFIKAVQSHSTLDWQTAFHRDKHSKEEVKTEEQFLKIGCTLHTDSSNDVQKFVKRVNLEIWNAE